LFVGTHSRVIRHGHLLRYVNHLDERLFPQRLNVADEIYLRAAENSPARFLFSRHNFKFVKTRLDSARLAFVHNPP